MHLHIISAVNTKKLKSSLLASDRLRLFYIQQAAKELGYKVSIGLNIPEADAYFIGALTKEIDEKIILKITKNITLKKILIFTDYVDDWLSVSNSKNREIYKKLIDLDAIFTVPVKGLKDKLKENINKIFFIPDAIDDIPNIDPVALNNKPRNVLWHGHASNIFSLIRVIGEKLVDYDFNLNLITNISAVEILKKTKFKKTPKCNLIIHNWSLNKIEEIAIKCDFAILPVNKKWASENRLITTFRLGLPIIAETISSYKPFSKYYSDFENDQIDNMFNNPEKSHKNVKLAQSKISKEYNSKKIIELWKLCLNTKQNFFT